MFPNIYLLCFYYAGTLVMLLAGVAMTFFPKQVQKSQLKDGFLDLYRPIRETPFYLKQLRVTGIVLIIGAVFAFIAPFTGRNGSMPKVNTSISTQQVH